MARSDVLAGRRAQNTVGEREEEEEEAFLPRDSVK